MGQPPDGPSEVCRTPSWVSGRQWRIVSIQPRFDRSPSIMLATGRWEFFANLRMETFNSSLNRDVAYN